MDTVLPMLFVASYNKLEYLHMQMLLNCYLASFEIKLDNMRPKGNLKGQCISIKTMQLHMISQLVKS